MKISSSRLTTCGVLRNGQTLHLDLVDGDGKDISLELPFDQAQAIAMTLPNLLTGALQELTGKATARYVFPLAQWLVERSDEHSGLLLTLATEDGFQVTFGVPAEACKGLGTTLAGNSTADNGADKADDETSAAPVATFN